MQGLARGRPRRAAPPTTRDVDVCRCRRRSQVYFAKFLTSSKLMTLQLRDGYFRRHVLVQILIFLQAVSTERKNVAPLSAAQVEFASVECPTSL